MPKELFPELPILVVDDDKHFLNSIDFKLRSNGITNVECCQESEEVMPLLQKQKYAIVLLDLLMPGVSGRELLLKIVEQYPEIPVIVLTGITHDLRLAIDCMKEGAFYFLTKPLDIDELRKTILDALDSKDSHRDIIIMKKRLFSDEQQESNVFPDIITQDDKMKSIFHKVGLIAGTSKPVLIRGECGVGKELIAAAIHKLSRRKGEFVTINTGGVDDLLFSDTLFGHAKGAFTGAIQSRKGMIEKAKNGTIFLDEIGELTVTSQVKLLRFIQNGEYIPLGEDKPKYSNARIVTATNKDLLASIKCGKFRDDLYFRLEIHDLFIPPLRKRKGDIPLLVDHFLNKAAKELKRNKPTVPEELYIRLANYIFPGNVRELESMVYNAISIHEKGILSVDAFLEKIEKNSRKDHHSTPKVVSKGENDFGESMPTFDEFKTLSFRVYFQEVMKRANGNQTIGAEMAGIKRERLRYWLNKFNIKS